MKATIVDEAGRSAWFVWPETDEPEPDPANGWEGWMTLAQAARQTRRWRIRHRNVERLMAIRRRRAARRAKGTRA